MTKIKTPDWVKHAVFYQIFPDRFAKSDKLVEAEQPRAVGQPADGRRLQGRRPARRGRAARPHPGRWASTAIYFTPIFQSASNHRYHTHDYYQVDPLLGGNAAFRTLLDEAHRRGLKVVLDGVFNHASRGFFQFNDILENGPHSP